MDENSEVQQTAQASVGEQLRAAREAKGLTLEDIANQTRIPRRHLEAIEASDWERLPAPTYTIGFAKSYASAVGVERADVAEGLRAEMGSPRPSTSASEAYEPADPARTMPRWLVVSAIVAIILAVIGLSWWKSSELDPGDRAADRETAAAPATAPSQAQGQPQSQAQPTPVPPPVAGPVVLTAREPVWLRVSERDGPTLYEGILAAGATYQVPPSAKAPVLRTGKPEALVATVGGGQAPPLGPPATTVSNVSLLGPDLMRAPPQPGATTAPPPPAAEPAR